MMLEDTSFLGKIAASSTTGSPPRPRCSHVVDEYVGAFSRMSDGYLRERATDVRDIGHRLLRNLLGVAEERARCRKRASWSPRS